MPISTSAILKKASSEQYLISQAATMSIAPPTQAPCIDAMVGILHSSSAVNAS